MSVSTHTVDTRGLSCPQPLVLVHEFLAGSEPLDVLVDNDASLENVSRAARNKGWTVTASDASDKAEGVTRLELRR